MMRAFLAGPVFGLCLGPVAACSDSDARLGNQDTSVVELSTGETEAETSDAQESGPRLDVGGNDEGVDVEGCTKIDFLFAVDSSGSMVDHQQNLADNFPGFIRAIEEELELEDFRIMVIDTDGPPLTCQASCDEIGGVCNRASCEGLPPVGSCEATLGAGRTTDLDGVRCPIEGEQPYLSMGQPRLDETFRCLANMGGGDKDETQMQAVVAALDPENLSEDGCNAGFIRPDAALVLTLITDEADEHSAGDPESWFEAVRAVKGGRESSIGVLTITLEAAPRIQDFASRFSYSEATSVQSSDYASFFVAAAEDVIELCGEFIPVE